MKGEGITLPDSEEEQIEHTLMQDDRGELNQFADQYQDITRWNGLRTGRVLGGGSVLVHKTLIYLCGASERYGPLHPEAVQQCVDHTFG